MFCLITFIGPISLHVTCLLNDRYRASFIVTRYDLRLQTPFVINVQYTPRYCQAIWVIFARRPSSCTRLLRYLYAIGGAAEGRIICFIGPPNYSTGWLCLTDRRRKSYDNFAIKKQNKNRTVVTMGFEFDRL